MIERYNVAEISTFWSDEYKFELFLKVELALLKVLENRKVIPVNTMNFFKDAKISVPRIYELEKTIKHDVISFCTSITEQVPSDAAKYFHFGVTSSDIIDTTLSLQIRSSIEVIKKDLSLLLTSLLELATKTKDVLSLGRSHGMYAEPLIFGQKFLAHFFELQRRLNDYEQVERNHLKGQCSGAVGSYSVLNLEIEKEFCSLLELTPETVSTQVISRDHHAKILLTGALLASALEKLAVHIRQLHQSDVFEVSEGFGKGQKGSSAMPHKKNPVASENISGLSRLVKSHLQVALENNVLWYERDISHSSSERLMMPDHFTLLSYMLKRSTQMINNLEIRKDHIEQKLKNFSAWSSGLILHQLLPHLSITREELYEIIQKEAFELKTSVDVKTYQHNIMEKLISLSLLTREKANTFSSFTFDELKKHYQTSFLEKLNTAHELLKSKDTCSLQ